MKFFPYNKLDLENPLWLRKKEFILKRDGYQCVIPGCTNKKGRNLEVHFKLYLFNKQEQKYIPPWKYDDILLTTLCKSHYIKTHKVFKIKTRNIN